METDRFEHYYALLRAPRHREGRDVGYLPLEGQELLDYQAAFAARARLPIDSVTKIKSPQKPEVSA